MGKNYGKALDANLIFGLNFPLSPSKWQSIQIKKLFSWKNIYTNFFIQKSALWKSIELGLNIIWKYIPDALAFPVF